MSFYSSHELTDGQRVAVLEEHARQEMSWRADMTTWRETVVRELTSLHVKVVFFSAIGAMVGSAVAGAVVYAVLHSLAAAPASHR